MALTELISDIGAFRHYLQSERGMADNTVQAYGRDLDRFTRWCALVRYHEYTAPTLRDLGRFGIQVAAERQRVFESRKEHRDVLALAFQSGTGRADLLGQGQRGIR